MKKYYPGPSSGKNYGEAGPAWVVAFFIRIALIILVIVSCALTFSSQANGLVVKNPVRLSGPATAAGCLYSFCQSSAFMKPVEQLLPVSLKSFTVKRTEEGVVLDWSSSMEKNVSHFAIERSVDGTDYTDIAIIFTEGDSSGDRAYRFADALKKVHAQVIYYRLRMVDLDQKYEYSPVRNVQLGK